MIKRILLVGIISVIMIVGGVGFAVSDSQMHLQNAASSARKDGVSNLVINSQTSFTPDNIISLPISTITVNDHESQKQIETNIGTLFLSWVDARNISLNIHNHNATKKLFRQFVSHNVKMSSFLKILSQVEEKADRKTHIDYNHLITMNQENGKSLSSSNYVVTSNDTQHNHVITVVRSNSTELIGIGSASVSPDSSSSQPFFWVTIHYFIFHAPWWLGGWSENYGQNDNFNLYLTGQAAASFNSEWMADTNIAALADIVFTFMGAAVAAAFASSGVGLAVGAALAAVGVGILYENSQMTSYYEGTGMQYIHLDFINDYYSPAEIVTLGIGSLSSSIGLIGEYNNGASPTVFWYNVPFAAYGGIAGVYFSSQLTGIAADFA